MLGYLELKGTGFGAQVALELNIKKCSSLRAMRVIDDMAPIVIVAVIDGKERNYNPDQLSRKSFGKVLDMMGFPGN